LEDYTKNTGKLNIQVADDIGSAAELAVKVSNSTSKWDDVAYWYFIFRNKKTKIYYLSHHTGVV